MLRSIGFQALRTKPDVIRSTRAAATHRLPGLKPNVGTLETPLRSVTDPKGLIDIGDFANAKGVSECKRVHPEWIQPKVVIVGAGIAGLSAANNLLQNGISDITILEAIDRPGGRIYSTWLADVVVEAGAEVIRGDGDTNTASHLANRSNVSRQRVSPKDGVYLTSDSYVLYRPKTVERLKKRILDKAVAAYGTDRGLRTGTLMQFLDLHIQQELMDFPEDERYFAETILWTLKNELSCRWGCDVEEMYTSQLGSFVEMEGGEARIPQGFIAVLTALIEGLTPGTVLYNSPVTKVVWGSAGTQGPRATLRCSDGRLFTADYCVVTLPLGVLKERMDEMFDPKLPESKRDAVRCLGVGHVTKVFLEYDKPWWSKGSADFSIAWSYDSLSEERHWATGIGSVGCVEGSDKVLAWSVGGSKAVDLEACREESIAMEFTKTLRALVSDPGLPFPKHVLRTRWCSDERFKGSQSRLTGDSGEEHQEELARPEPRHPGVSPVLYFAGEAAVPGQHGTVHAARLSGLRVAQSILSETETHRGPPIFPSQPELIGD